MPPSLTRPEQEYLLKLARATIERAVAGEKLQPPPPAGLTSRLLEDGASFVTLHTQEGVLRGCIGSLAARRLLVEDVQHNALAAAFDDPRFPPLSARETPAIVVEVSVLTPPEPLTFSDLQALIQQLRPHVDGVFLEHGWHRGTFLPQVWEQLPTPEEFLRHLALKARLPSDAWQWPDVKISTYQVEKFSEAV